MRNVFSELDFATAKAASQLARLTYDLREQRKSLLASCGVEHEEQLLVALRAGSAPEHPTYEQYLAACTLAQTHAQLRAELARMTGMAAGGASARATPRPDCAPPAADDSEGTLLQQLALQVELDFGEYLAAPVGQSLDAISVRFQNATHLEARFASADAYSLVWSNGAAETRLDTAPGPDRAAASHLHDASGKLLADPLTQPGRAPWDNLRAVILHLLRT